MRRKRRKVLDKVNTVATVIGCAGAAFQFSFGAFVLGDHHPVTIAVVVIALVAMATSVITGGMIYGK